MHFGQDLSLLITCLQQIHFSRIRCHFNGLCSFRLGHGVQVSCREFCFVPVNDYLNRRRVPLVTRYILA
jgi:hypothetical protein